MNTVKIGDNFEKKCKVIITKAINNSEFGISPSFCTIYEKKKYYSIKRNGDIIFDLVIEVKPPKANKPFLVCIIECKNLNKAVPVDDIEEFESKVSGLQGFQTKKIFISRNGFQKGAFEVAKNTGITLIEVKESTYKILLHKNEKKQVDSKFENIETVIHKAFIQNKNNGIKKLSAKQINNIAVEFLKSVNPGIISECRKTPIENIIKHLKKELGIKTVFKRNLVDQNSNKLLGYFDGSIQTIIINEEVRNTIRFPFVFAHELGHAILHENITIHQLIYDGLQDSIHSLFLQKSILTNDRNWIEWQANCFASCLLMPETSIKILLHVVQTKLGISKQGRIYLDSQEVNQKDFYKIIKELSDYFEVGKLHVEYRLEKIGLIIRPPIPKEDEIQKEWLRDLSKMNSNNKC